MATTCTAEGTELVIDELLVPFRFTSSAKVKSQIIRIFLSRPPFSNSLLLAKAASALHLIYRDKIKYQGQGAKGNNK